MLNSAKKNFSRLKKNNLLKIPSLFQTKSTSNLTSNSIHSSFHSKSLKQKDGLHYESNIFQILSQFNHSSSTSSSSTPFPKFETNVKSIPSTVKLKANVDQWRLSACTYSNSIHSSGVVEFQNQVKRSQVAVWGNGGFGRLGLGNEQSSNVPTICHLDDDVEVCHVACGGAHTILATVDGKLFSMGLNDHGQLGNPKTIVYSNYPIEIEKEKHKIKYLSAGHYHSGYISEAGELFVWGNNSSGQLGIGRDDKHSSIPIQVSFFKNKKIIQIAFGAEHSLAITEDGELYSWGKKGYGRLGLGQTSIFQNLYGHHSETSPKLVDAFKGIKIKNISTGHLHSAVVDEYGNAFTFGYGRFGQMGMGDEVDLYEPKKIQNLKQIQKIACGGNHTMAINEDGDLFAWGGNEHGCLGLGDEVSINKRIPNQIKNEIKRHTIIDIACGWKHSAAISADGKLFTWGWGGSQGTFSVETSSSGGQLGLGNEFDRFEPTFVEKGVFNPKNNQKPSKAIQISCGFNHTAAVVQ